MNGKMVAIKLFEKEVTNKILMKKEQEKNQWIKICTLL